MRLGGIKLVSIGLRIGIKVHYVYVCVCINIIGNI